jgi:dTDP-4-dehydrorhamnose reductase
VTRCGPILLLGADGQLGGELAARLPVEARTRRDLDVTDARRVEAAVTALKPALVLNATAYPKVDACETEPGPAFAVNAVAVHHLARAAMRSRARLVHFSTDYVFGAGRPGPYAEDAPPAPVNVYGASKLAGEQLALAADARSLVIRSSGLYGRRGSRAKGGNFVEAMLRLAREGRPIRVVDDQTLAPTSAADLADAVVRLLAADPPGGVYHLTNAGACSWFEFAQRVFAIAGLRPEVHPVSSEAYAAAARRPVNSVLLNHRAAVLGLPALRPWQEALEAYLRDVGAAT